MPEKFRAHPPIKGVPLYDPAHPEPRFFTAMWTGNYLIWDYRENVGSHPGVDIDATKYPGGKTPVFAVMDGRVVAARRQSSGPGHHLVLRHDGCPDPEDFHRKITLFSNYEHLSKFLVKVGETVRAGDQIGVTGTTGNSTGPHLHFQIDRETAPEHPFWPFSYAEIARTGLDFWAAVNSGFGLEKTKKFTISPLDYVQRFYSDSKFPFPDVDPAHPHFAAISWLKKQKVVRGYADGFFYASQPVTRAEWLKIVFEAIGIRTTAPAAAPFPDVPASSWAAPFVESAVLRGVVGGEIDRRTGRTVFRPDRAVSRAEAAKILFLSAGVPVPVGAPAPADVRPGLWFADFAAEAVRRKLLDFQGGKFLPGNFLTRGEAAEMLFRLIGAK